jgi:hypothetical protein
MALVVPMLVTVTNQNFVLEGEQSRANNKNGSSDLRRIGIGAGTTSGGIRQHLQRFLNVRLR